MQAFALGLILTTLAMVALADGASATTAYEMGGEWQYEATCGGCTPPSATGTLLLGKTNQATGEFSGSTLLLGLLPGTASGTVKGEEVTLKIVLQTPNGEEPITMPNGTLQPASNEFAGSIYYNSGSPTGEIKASLKRSLAQIEKEELEAAKRAKEKAEKEKAEREAEEKQIAKEKQEAKEVREKQEVQEKAEAEKHQTELQERQAREQREAKEAQEAKAAQEAKEKAERERMSDSGGSSTASGAALVAVAPASRMLAVGGSETVALGLANANHYAISGAVSLIASTGAASHGTQGRGHSTVLARGSFSIPSDAHGSVKLRLSASAAAMLRRHGRLRLAIKTVTRSPGHAAVSKTYAVTLRGTGRRHG